MEKKKPGFTLIEMIIALALTVTILGIAGSMLVTGNKVFSDSDIRSTLQIEGQAIQEKISDIGMQAFSVESCKYGSLDIKNKNYNSDDIVSKLVNIKGEFSENREWIDVSQISFKSSRNNSEYDSSTDAITNTETIPISYDKNLKKLSIDSEVISEKVESIRIRPGNINDGNSTINEADSIEFNIVLSKKKAFSNVTYPIDFTIKFRNK
ncbi:type II secretion system protein [Clostridium chromiireducens]|uniref:Type II secretion system protein n=1 Tax=Clostridium chromiireducens TaxID=225345 RepID=A0A399ISV2_9CLOT|nr:type II secretion system protein [Clostridium chromiireducens]RII36125.1 type II secretion system protein [Clostridium chromiireducens]